MILGPAKMISTECDVSMVGPYVAVCYGTATKSAPPTVVAMFTIEELAAARNHMHRLRKQDPHGTYNIYEVTAQ